MIQQIFTFSSFSDLLSSNSGWSSHEQDNLEEETNGDSQIENDEETREESASGTRGETRRSDRLKLKANDFHILIPDEIKLQIFEHLSQSSIKDVCNAMLVCRDFYRLLADDSIWFSLCKKHSLVDGRGNDLQKITLKKIEQEEREKEKRAINEDSEEIVEKEDATSNEERLEEESGLENEMPASPEGGQSWRNYFLKQKKESLFNTSTKLSFLLKLLPQLKKKGNRVLIFSQSRKMLAFIELLLNTHNYKFLRIDGSVAKSEERQKRVDLFNSDKQYFCFLLTTLVGGVGLNLTGADRVVIVDPSWNPCHDNQVSCGTPNKHTLRILIRLV